MKHIVCLFALFLFSASLAGVTNISVETGEVVPAHVGLNPAYQPSSYEVPSRDVGEWTGSGPWGGNIRSIVTDPTDPMHVFAACGLHLAQQAGGVYSSTDGGVNWQPTALQGKPYYALAASPSEPGTFYAGARNGLYKSTDNGATWDPAGLTTSFILALGVKADDPNTIVVGKSGNVGIVVSTDGGLNFNAVGVNSGFMRMFTTSAANPQRMFVVMGSSASSVLTSVDNGQTWSPYGPGGDGWGMYVSPTDSLFSIVAHANGLYRTTDGGVNWEMTESGTFRSVVEYNGIFFATSNAGGVYESNDQGQSWQAYNEGVVQSTWQAGASTGAGALLGCWGAIFRVTGFQTPLVASHTGINAAFVHGLAYYSDTNELWAGSEGSGLYCSTDNGVTWEQRVNGLDNWMVYELVPTNHQYYHSGRMLAGTLDGVYTSVDGGNTWSFVYYDGVQCSALEVHPTDPDKFWIGTAMGEVRYTEDGGQTWTVATGGMWGFAPRLKLGRGPLGNLRLFCSFQSSATAVWYSDDGVSFSPSTGMESTSYQPQVSVRPLIGTQPQIIYASSNSGIYKSTDNGATYSVAGMPGFSWCVLSGPGQQVISGKDNGLSYSVDEGQTSTSLTQNLSSTTIWQMAWGSSTNQVYIATQGKGVFENRFSATEYNAPQELAAYPDDQQVILIWQPVTTDPAPIAYYIWRDCYPAGQVTPDLCTYTDTGLTNGQSYTYYVSAVYNDHVQTLPQEIVTATPEVPTHFPPTGLTATVVENDVTLDWETLINNALTGFNIYRDGTLVNTVDDDVFTFTDLDLENGTYTYGVTAIYVTGESEPAMTDVTVDYVSNEDDSAPPASTGLAGISPNPFKRNARIDFNLKENATVSIRIYSLRGQLVTTIINEDKAPGNHSITWNGKDDRGQDVPNGVYLCSMKAGDYSGSAKLILMK